MKKIGFIPLHFVSFLYNEGIDIIEFKSSHQTQPEEYDKMVVRFPYCTRTFDIQIIFDNRNNTLPPDFIIINDGDFYMDYTYIIHNWNFRDSGTLYLSLFYLKQLYSMEQERRLMELLKLNNHNDQNRSTNMRDPDRRISHFYSSRSMLFEYLEKILFYIKSNFMSYKFVPKSLQLVDIYQEKEEKEANDSKEEPTEEIKQVVISYPIDILIRERSIPRPPLLNITIPLIPVSEMKFWIELTLPHFIGMNGFNILKEKEELGNFKSFISGYEKYVLSQINNMKCREKIIMDIIASNIGFVLEVDTFSFLSFALLFHYVKKTIDKKSVDYDYLIYFVFCIEDNTKFELQIIDCRSLTIILRINVEYDIYALYSQKIVKIVLSAISECVHVKKKTLGNSL